MKLAACAIVRDEARDIGEWIAHHLAIGFDSVILYDNNSIDDTRDIASRFRPRFDVRVKHWPRTDETTQPEAYEDCLATELDYDWIAFIDADELIVPRKGNIRDILEANTVASAIGISWAAFGSSGHKTRPPGLMTETFTRRAKSDHKLCRPMKQIVRPGKVYGVAGACTFEVRGPFVTPSGKPITRQSLLRPEHSVCQLNHYITKSHAEWDARRERGYRTASENSRRMRNDFAACDRSEVVDHAALRWVPKVREILAAVELLKLLVDTQNRIGVREALELENSERSNLSVRLL